MKKKTVSNDSLKEKIEEILTPYPDPMSRNDFRIVCHIGFLFMIVFQKVCKFQFIYFCNRTVKNNLLWNLHMSK